MTVTAAMVKELREKTGAGILDAKKALTENNGDMEKAMEYLRQKGIASADKKMGRIAAEGLVCSYVEGNIGALIEVNCETDFVAKNEEFKELVSNLAKQVVATKPADVDALLASTCTVCDCGKKIEDIIKEKVATIGEKITVRRFEIVEGNPATYIHNGKIGVLLNTDKADEVIGKDICLHIASNAPDSFQEKKFLNQLLMKKQESKWVKKTLLTNLNKSELKLLKAELTN